MKYLLSIIKKLIFNKKLQLNQSIMIHETAILLSNCTFRFDLNKEERFYVEVGKDCLLSACNFIFESSSGFIKIGDNVNIGGANLISRSEIIIGNNVTMAWGITIYDHDSHSIYWNERKNDNKNCYEDYKLSKNRVLSKDWTNVRSKKILINDKVWIGFDVLILKGVTIGEGAVVAAKSVVTKDVPAWSLVAGNPAKFIKYINVE